MSEEKRKEEGQLVYEEKRKVMEAVVEARRVLEVVAAGRRLGMMPVAAEFVKGSSWSVPKKQMSVEIRPKKNPCWHCKKAGADCIWVTE